MNIQDPTRNVQYSSEEGRGEKGTGIFWGAKAVRAFFGGEGGQGDISLVQKFVAGIRRVMGFQKGGLDKHGLF
ncbi:MAG: hypothetical protein K9M57_05855 [Phycisphaerae bacterium]|nr:hypothetical protein [Phycisphaerae bacterium]